MGTLYLVATPIGNLEDITLRALRLLREVDLIAAEDTRTARKLMSHYEIRRPLVSYNEHNKRHRTAVLLEALSRGDVALVSEAGTPTISDPGVDLAAAAWEAGHRVVPVPGPSVLTAALAAAGLPTRRFLYLGFLPRQAGALRRLLRPLAAAAETLVAFEAPHRLRQSLPVLVEELGDRRVAVCRELTKLHEEVFRGRLTEAMAHFQEPRGEFTLVIEGAAGEVGGAGGDVTEEARREARRLRSEGLPARQAVAQLAQAFGLSRRRAYGLWLEK